MNAALFIVVLVNAVLPSMATHDLNSHLGLKLDLKGGSLAAKHHSPLTTSLNSFGFKLLKSGLGAADKNTCFSPISISSCLSTVLAGCEGQTGNELKSHLGFGHFENQVNINGAFKGFFKKIHKGSSAAVQVASRVMAAKDITLRKPFIDTCRNDYNAQAVSADFKNTKATMNDANKWVREQTKQKIPQILSKPLPVDSKLVLLSAIHIRGEWKHRFDVNKTKKGTFQGSNGNANTNVMFMDKTQNCDVYEDNSKGYKMVNLPYQNNISMVIVLPDVGKTISSVVEGFTLQVLDSSLKATRQVLVRVKLPRFKVEETYHLGDTLQNLGIRQVFGSDANLSGISKTSVKVDQVVHKAVCEVDERGSAAPAPSVVESAAPVDFFVERPFAYFIKDASAGHVLLSGIINNL